MKKTLSIILVCSVLTSISLLSGCKSENEKEFDKLKEEQVVFTVNDLPQALVKAINGREEILVKRLLFAGASPNSTDEAGNSVLMLACHAQDNNIIDAILSYQPDVNLANKEKETAVNIAIGQGNGVLLDKLIKAGASLNFVNAYGYTPLSEACAAGNTEMVVKLLECGANPNQQVDPGSEPICVALDNGNFEAFTTLLQHKVNINVTTASGAPLISQVIAMDAVPLMSAILTTAEPLNEQTMELASRGLSSAISTGSEEMVRLLLNAGITPSAEGGSAVKQAVMSTNMGIIAAVVESSKDLAVDDPWVKVAQQLTERHRLICEGVLSTERMMDPNTKKPRWGQIMKNALINAISKNDTVLTQRLLKAGASPYASGSKGSAIEYAIKVDNADILKMLHETGAPLAEKMKPHALGLAAEINACKCIEYMLKLGIPADTMAPNDREETPLRKAIKNKCIEAATLLINNGADVNNIASGMEPIAFEAVNISSLKLVELMLQKGVYVDTYVYYTGETLLMRAANVSTAAMVELLIKHGANPNEVNAKGATPVIYAAYGCNFDTMQMLESKGADLKYKVKYADGGKGYLGAGGTAIDTAYSYDASAVAYWWANNDAEYREIASRIYRYLIEKGAARQGSPEKGCRVVTSPYMQIHDDYPEYISENMRRRAEINHARMQAKMKGGTTSDAATEGQSATGPAAAEQAAEDSLQSHGDKSVSAESLKSLKLLYERLARLKCKQEFSAYCQKHLLMLLDCIRQGDGVNCTRPETQGSTALHYSCALGSLSITMWLLENGANPNARSEKGVDPKSCVGSDNRAAIIKLLNQYGAK